MKKILLVEDDALLNKTLTYNLISEGYDTVSALNAGTAAGLLTQTEYDLVLLDINLPDGSGYDLCRLIKPFCKNPKQILTRQRLLERLWDAEENYVDEHTLTTAISRIRGKIEADGGTYIKTIYGIGYQWMGGGKK